MNLKIFFNIHGCVKCKAAKKDAHHWSLHENGYSDAHPVLNDIM